MRQISLAIVDDHPVLLRGLASIFEDDPRFVVTGSGDCAAHAAALVRDSQPDIIVIDLSMPGDVFSMIASVAGSESHTRIIVYTAFSSTDSAIKALDAGATGFVLKGSPIDELYEAIDCVLEGKLYVSRHFATQVLSGLRTRKSDLQETVRLNVREKQIVAQLLQARTNKEIARELNLSEKTVKHYMTGLMLKLRARNRVEVAMAARRQEAVTLHS